MDRRTGWLKGPTLTTNRSAESTGKANATWVRVSRPSHQVTMRGGGRSASGTPARIVSMVSRFAVALVLLAVACDPVSGTGNGTPPDLKQFLHTDAATRSVVVTLIPGYPVGSYQYNYNGYAGGSLVLTVPAAWQVTVQCQNRGTVPNSCAVVGDPKATAPVRPGWSTPDPVQGIQPG